MVNHILYIVFILLMKVICFLPLSISKKIPSILAFITYKLGSKRNKSVRENIKKAFPEYSIEECENLLKKVYYNFSMVLVEFMLLEKLSSTDLNNCISEEGKEYLGQVHNKDNGIILYTAHFGNWEWLGTYYAAQGNTITAIAKEQKNYLFDKKITEIRESKGAKVITKDLSLRKIYKTLLRGKTVLILADQHAGNDGWILEFFARKASAFSGPVRLAVKTGASILPIFIIREGWMKHKIVYYPPYNIDKDASDDEQRELLQELTKLTEKTIREYPEQWFWLHNRWKVRE
ncbi:lysophospholipid acyltransferase family protein [Natronospora cellulosivora (SeqCode)]